MMTCPVCGEHAKSYKVTYGYADCPQGCGSPIKTPCTDEALFLPCGHVLTGQAAISAWELGRPTLAGGGVHA
jgi:hypothetical protein